MGVVCCYFRSFNFRRGLELGAGDGFQSHILKEYVDELFCTELDQKRLIKTDEDIRYRICDAEKIGAHFPANYFDLVFSSNLFEHLPDPCSALKGIWTVQQNDGISIHIIPSSFSALIRIILWYPAKFKGVCQKLLKGEKLKYQAKTSGTEAGAPRYVDNNLKVERRYKNNLSRLLIPRPHGVSKNVLLEIFACRKKLWIKRIEENGFVVMDILKGPVCSGYGFGLNYVRNILEKIGFTSEYIYVFKKNGSACHSKGSYS